jgi:hypothetical protein
MTKPILLLSTARSGSTPVYRILASYLEQHQKIEPMQELLNPYFGDYRLRGGRLLLLSETHNRLTIPAHHREFKRRLRLAKRFHGQLFYKVFPSAFRGPANDWLLKNYRFATCERLDRFAQVMSFLVSASSGKWYKTGGLKIPAATLKASFQEFQAIEASLFVFLLLTRQSSPSQYLRMKIFVKWNQKN